MTGDGRGDGTGDVTGDVRGDVTGDVRWDVTGDVKVDVTGDVLERDMLNQRWGSARCACVRNRSFGRYFAAI